MAKTCELCGLPVRVVSDREGTSHYEAELHNEGEDWRRDWGKAVRSSTEHPDARLGPAISRATVRAADAALKAAEGAYQTVAVATEFVTVNGVLFLNAAKHQVVCSRHRERAEVAEAEIARLRAEVVRLTGDLAVNAKLLARQCDLAREAESNLDHVSADLIDAVAERDELRVVLYGVLHCSICGGIGVKSIGSVIYDATDPEPEPDICECRKAAEAELRGERGAS